MHHGTAFDYAWVIYWQTISAEVGLVMTSATAFRAFFVTCGGNSNSHGGGGRSSKSNVGGRRWASKTKQLLHLFSTQKMRQSRHTSATAIGDQKDSELKQLPPIYRGTITGVRTFINSRGRTSTFASRVMQSRVSEEGDDSSLMSAKIQVQHEISSQPERVRVWFQEEESARKGAICLCSPQRSDDSSNAQCGRERV